MTSTSSKTPSANSPTSASPKRSASAAPKATATPKTATSPKTPAAPQTPQKTSPAKPPKDPKPNHNLVLLGVAATVVALVTTSISLFIYHASGDIYLDRSRPGFLPDESEADEFESETSNYKYPDSGPIDQESLTEYLFYLDDYQEDLNNLPNPYPASSLSDQALGISAETPTSPNSDSDSDPEPEPDTSTPEEASE